MVVFSGHILFSFAETQMLTNLKLLFKKCNASLPVETQILYYLNNACQYFQKFNYFVLYMLHISVS